MKVALVQINPTVGDFSGNLGKILCRAQEASRLGADLAIFPELSLVGYPPMDLLENRSFVRRAGEVLAELLSRSRGIPSSLLLGTIVPTDSPGEGKPLHNAALLVCRGVVRAVHRKVLLPTYDVFDESRYFEPGRELTSVSLDGKKFFLSLCEDAWNDKTFWTNRHYRRDPVEDRMEGERIPLLNISSSPYSQGKGLLRLQMLQNIARRWRVPVLYVNQVGGNDSLVFDGRSMAVGPGGELVAMAKGFVEDLIMVDLDRLPPPFPPSPLWTTTRPSSPPWSPALRTTPASAASRRRSWVSPAASTPPLPPSSPRRRSVPGTSTGSSCPPPLPPPPRWRTPSPWPGTSASA